jgi:hypothetical protein
MWLPKSAGKSVASYIADGTSTLDRAEFERAVREYVGLSLGDQLLQDDFQVLFEISDAYFRTYSAVCLMTKQKLTADWKSREKMMADTESGLGELQADLRTYSGDPQRPVAGLLAQSVSDQLSKLQSELSREFEAIRLHQTLSEGMLRALHFKNLRNSFVARLNSYVGDIALRLNLKQKGADKIIAGAMSAAKAFSEKEKADDVLERIPMARSRAQAHIKREILDLGEFPVFQAKPKRKPTV